MPIIARIKGIIIRMFFEDHPPPHIHASNQDKSGLIDIKRLEMLEGNLSNKDMKEVKHWGKNKKKRLLDMWDSQEIKKID